MKRILYCIHAGRLVLAQAELVSLLGGGAGGGVSLPEWREETCLVEYAPAAVAALEARVREVTSPQPPAPAQQQAAPPAPAMGAAMGAAGGGQHTVWGWVERQAGAARAAAAAAADAPALQPMAAPSAVPMEVEGAHATSAPPPPSSDADFPPLGASAPPQQPSAAAMRRTRAEFWAALTAALGAEPLETEDAELSCAMYLVAGAGGAHLLLEVSLPREGFPAAAPQVALGALDGPSGAANDDGGGGGAGPAATPPRLRLRWAPHLGMHAAAQRLAEAVARRAAAWPGYAAEDDDDVTAMADRTQRTTYDFL